MNSTVPAWLRRSPDSVANWSLRQGRSPWADAVHVLWSVWIFAMPMFSEQGYDLRWFLLTLLSYPVFLLLYLRILLGPMRNAWKPALGMVVLCLVLLPWYPEGMSYFVFGCVLLHLWHRRPRRVYLVQVLGLNLVFLAWGFVLDYPWQVLMWVPVVTIIVGMVVQVERAGQEKEAALRLSRDEVRRLAAAAERERIGRDLHDVLGHTLSMVALKSDLAARLLERDPAAARHEIEEVGRSAREALDQVRSAVSGIRAAELAAELAAARLLLETAGIEFDYVMTEAFVHAGLPPEVETALALTVRESATNIQRHAGADSAEAAFALEGDEAVVRIDDDGCGGTIMPGNGLAGMRERLQALGGSLRIDTAGRQQGLRIEARVPLKVAASGEQPG